jgi:ubiquinone/menaquinone biosynthesis C-methylase UbiE
VIDPREAATDDRSRAYYDAFSKRYDERRGGREPFGYHDLVDDLEVEMVERFARGRDLLEVGCGTGLLLERFGRFARKARGIDLSQGMLERAIARGLDVTLGSATELPFEDASFDVTCSFKVLPHIPDIRRAVSEMFRVTRPGGFVIAEFYNRHSIRALAKQVAGAQRIADEKDESHVFVRLESTSEIAAHFPRSATRVATRGIRIVTPFAHVLRVPALRTIFARTERALADSPLSRFGGFYVVAYEKAR